MEPQTSKADMPTRLSNQVKTMPEPQIVVRKVRREAKRDILCGGVSLVLN